MLSFTSSWARVAGRLLSSYSLGLLCPPQIRCPSGLGVCSGTTSCLLAGECSALSAQTVAWVLLAVLQRGNKLLGRRQWDQW